MELVWTAYGQEPRDACAAPLGEDRERPARPGMGAMRVAMARVAAAACLGWLLLALHHAPPQAPAPTATIDAPFAVDRALTPLATLQLGGAHQSPGYVARSRGATGERRDTLTVGDWAGDGPFLSLTLRTDATPPGSLFVDLATQSAALGFGVLRAENSENLAGGRALMEWARATLSGQGRERECASFRLVKGGAAHISGFACRASDAPLDGAAIVCLIDALALTDMGRALGLGAALPGAPTHRIECGRGFV